MPSPLRAEVTPLGRDGSSRRELVQRRGAVVRASLAAPIAGERSRSAVMGTAGTGENSPSGAGESSHRASAPALTLGVALLATTALLLGTSSGAGARQGKVVRHGGHRSVKRISL